LAAYIPINGDHVDQAAAGAFSRPGGRCQRAAGCGGEVPGPRPATP